MTEIEKMFKNAGCLIVTACHIEYKDGSTCNCLYPTFTAEKQLELIKWLSFRDYITIVSYISGEYHSEHDKYNADENSLEGCLARLINNLWQDLTKSEKEEIRGILNG